MSGKNKKQFGIWMDSQHASVVGKNESGPDEFVLIGQEKNEESTSNSNENASNNQERTLQAKFFKKITSHMQNADEVHVSGTGQVQEQFVRYLSETPQYKSTVATHSTSNKMSDEKVVEFIASKFQ